MAVMFDTCPVCGGHFTDGEGVTVLHRGQLIRLRCEHCADRFLADPERYLAGHPAACCPGPKDGPFSEWRCE